MRKLRFFSTLLLLLFIFVGCDAPFEPSGCPEWDALIELQEENIKCVMFYDLATIKNESSAYVAPQPEGYVPDNLLTHEQIEEWIALLKSLDCKFEKSIFNVSFKISLLVITQNSIPCVFIPLGANKPHSTTSSINSELTSLSK